MLPVSMIATTQLIATHLSLYTSCLAGDEALRETQGQAMRHGGEVLGAGARAQASHLTEPSHLPGGSARGGDALEGRRTEQEPGHREVPWRARFHTQCTQGAASSGGDDSIDCVTQCHGSLRLWLCAIPSLVRQLLLYVGTRCYGVCLSSTILRSDFIVPFW